MKNTHRRLAGLVAVPLFAIGACAPGPYRAGPRAASFNEPTFHGPDYPASSAQVTPVQSSSHHVYKFVHGRTVMLRKNGNAVAPRHMPNEVHLAVQAGNALQGMPYKYGGGHRTVDDDGYDCSGTVSYVLNKAGLLNGTNTSSGFTTYGEPGPGKWITVFAKPGHAFVVIGGLRLDTGGGRNETGPRWKTGSRRTDGFVQRHPPGL